MQPETRDAQLYGQLQEELRHHIMEGPAVSRAVDYQALCVAAKNEERRQSELRKRRQYQKPTSSYRPSRTKGSQNRLTIVQRAPPHPQPRDATTVIDLGTCCGTAHGGMWGVAAGHLATPSLALPSKCRQQRVAIPRRRPTHLISRTHLLKTRVKYARSE